MHDVTAIFKRARSFKPQREINVSFSGGGATLSPIFLTPFGMPRAWASSDFMSLRIIRFAQEKGFAVQADMEMGGR